MRDKSPEGYIREIEDLRSLLKATHFLTSGHRLEEVLENTLKHAMSVTSSEASSIWLLEEDTKTLTPFVSIGERSEVLKGVSIKLGDGIAGEVAQTQKPILVKRARSDERFNEKIDQKTGFTTRNILCVGLKTGDDIIGSLQVLNKVGGKSFSRRDLEILSAFASLAVGLIKNGKLHNDIQVLYTSTMKSLVATIDARDPYTAGHSDRVSKLVANTCQNLGIDSDTADLFERGGLLHDIGKIGVNDSILRKKGKLSPMEYEQIKRHPIIGMNIVKEIEPKKLSRELVKGIRYHHERMDSKGYPEGIPGKKIPQMAKVIAAADTYDALTSDRSYRRSFSRDKAVTIMRACAGTQLDKRIVEKLLDTV